LWLYRPYLLCSTHFEKGQTLVDVRVGWNLEFVIQGDAKQNPNWVGWKEVES
jgi:hypothetical protein